MNLIQYRKACNDYAHEQGMVVLSDDFEVLQAIYDQAAQQKMIDSMSTDHVKLIAKAYFEGRAKGARLQRKMTQEVTAGMRKGRKTFLESLQR